jgi:hypothetical protein
VDRSTYLSLLSSFFLKGLRFSIRLQNSKFFLAKESERVSTSAGNFSIVITTFQERFDVYALPLIESIRSVSNIPITLVINGNLASLIEPHKLQGFLEKVSRHPHVYPVTFQSFQGCAKMWNTGIIHSRESNILILNDDISLLPEHFEFDATRATSLLSESGVLTLNSSWSHFLINRECIKKIGWFDEHFVGIGNEDGEYAERYTNLTGNYIPTLMVHAFANISDSTRDLTVASTESKYSLFNSVLNQLRHDSPPTRPLINPYPMFDWRNRMAELLSVSDPSVVREAIKLELEKP